MLSNEVNNTDKIAVFVANAKGSAYRFCPPDVNKSHLKFVPEAREGKRAIRYGLAAIKNIGEGAMQSAIAEREERGPFKSLEDYCSRLDSKSVNRKILENLIRAGAFDFTGRDRAELFARIDQALATGASANRDRRSGQVSLFGDLELAPAPKTNGDTVHLPVVSAENSGTKKTSWAFTSPDIR